MTTHKTGTRDERLVARLALAKARKELTPVVDSRRELVRHRYTYVPNCAISRGNTL